MASNSGLLAIANLMATAFLSFEACHAARHLVEATAPATALGIPTLATPTLRTLPPMPAVPTIPAVAVAVAPMPTVPQVALPPMASIPTTVPKVSLPPISSVPAIPSIPFLPHPVTCSCPMMAMQSSCTEH
ncbi:hypothetical protein MUK42_22283 [Musa troglodytarum]|uniref:Uncharacterized protein n=1 Tax=Musa troglodytarum TaxID=320322 RepID=A0A9E7GB34_9LILI|nr:hypothetical protein MUK42_22283 [Musa troglodytarum]